MRGHRDHRADPARARTRSDDLVETLHDTRIAIHAAVEQAGIEIAFGRAAPQERR